MKVRLKSPLLRVLSGDCIDEMGKLAGSSIDAIATDPPYSLEFMEDPNWKTHGASFRPSETGKSLPAYGSAWRNKRCNKCQKLASGAPKYRCQCPSPSWVVERGDTALAGRKFQAWCGLWATEAIRVLKPGGHIAVFGGARTYHRMACALEDAGFEIRDCLSWLYGKGLPKSTNLGKAARKLGSADWDGWGTNLRPGWDPIILARKYPTTTTAANLLRHGVGGINVDACRIPGGGTEVDRFPANVLTDEAAEVCRHFYCLTVDSADRNSGMSDGAVNPHPTVKPVELMKWLVKLITPPRGLVLDPFCGSGTTGIACRHLGFRFIGIERNSVYADAARKRIGL